MRILVTGGAGFIGSAVCRYFAANPDHHVVNIDKLSYAGQLTSLGDVVRSPSYRFYRLDIRNQRKMLEVLQREDIDAVMHLAAESHVDRSIDRPDAFIETNIVGTFHLLSAVLAYWRELPARRKEAFRFHHVSTDEVYGDLRLDEGLFSEASPYAPSSPYSASKAASDHLARAWHLTYGLPVVLSHSSNNYGPFQFPEKLIPLMILRAWHELPLPVYGAGQNVRDWLHVEDHVRGLEQVLLKGRVGESYMLGGRSERSNLTVVKTICDLLDDKNPRRSGASYRDLITFVEDRLGHDERYAVDCSKIEREIGWKLQHSFASGLQHTVDWYLENAWWWQPIRQKVYRGNRLGLLADAV